VKYVNHQDGGVCGNSEKPLFQFPSDNGVRAKWFEILREICGTRKEIR
jgi:hypothetical protein